MKKIISLLLALMMVLSVCAMATAEAPKGKVMLYSSMQEAQLQAIEQALRRNIPAWIWNTTMLAAASWSPR